MILSRDVKYSPAAAAAAGEYLTPVLESVRNLSNSVFASFVILHESVRFLSDYPVFEVLLEPKASNVFYRYANWPSATWLFII